MTALADVRHRPERTLTWADHQPARHPTRISLLPNRGAISSGAERSTSLIFLRILRRAMRRCVLMRRIVR